MHVHADVKTSGAIRHNGGVTEPAPAAGVEEPTRAQYDTAATMLGLVADPTRLRMLWWLCREPADVGTLAGRLGVTPSAASQHLGRLRLGGLVDLRKDGRRHVYAARGGHVRALVDQVLYHADHQVGGHPVHE
jgi:DNA-binding transcriptional ArsR family regulator